MNSPILSISDCYVRYLGKFLEPVVGGNSHWLLCWRASLHGWRADQFHTRCDGKNDTVTIVRKDTYVFGGYTDIPWGKKLTPWFSGGCRGGARGPGPLIFRPNWGSKGCKKRSAGIVHDTHFKQASQVMSCLLPATSLVIPVLSLILSLNFRITVCSRLLLLASL